MPKIEPTVIESTEEKKEKDVLTLAKELHESNEVFPFPGLRPEAYAQLKATDEEFPGYVTPIDGLLERFKNEGMKVVLGKNPKVEMFLYSPHRVTT